MPMSGLGHEAVLRALGVENPGLYAEFPGLKSLSDIFKAHRRKLRKQKRQSGYARIAKCGGRGECVRRARNFAKHGHMG